MNPWADPALDEHWRALHCRTLQNDFASRAADGTWRRDPLCLVWGMPAADVAPPRACRRGSMGVAADVTVTVPVTILYQ